MIKSKINILVLVLVVTVLMSSCKKSYPHWTTTQTIELSNDRPMGIASQGDDFWISDGFENTVNRYDSNFKLIESVAGFERPMHISANGKKVFVPEYGSDKVIVISNGQKDTLNIPIELNTPAAFSMEGRKSAVVSFYGNSIVLGDNDNWIVIGQDGEADGEFHAPTDIQIFNDTVYVADAYNNRVQLFDIAGNHIRTIGEELGLDNAAGLFVTKKEIFVTDYENHRVLVLDRQGALLDEITEGLDQPIDVLVKNDRLYIINFGSGEVVVLSQNQ